MMVSLGAQEKTFCFQHLLRHAYFKSLLFICVGICIHSIYGRQDFRRFGMLSPALFASVFATVANFSLIGFVYTAGFHSKDGIIEILYTKGASSCFLCFFLLAIGLTTCYSLKIQYIIIPRYNMTLSSCWTLGGYRWPIKTPLLILGSASVGYSAKPNVITVVLGSYDKVLPLLLIRLGSFVGATLPLTNQPLMRSIMNLTPMTQNFAAISVSIAVPQKVIDKGWVESWSYTLSVLSHTLIGHNSAVLSLGFAGFFLFLLFYDQYYKKDHRIISKLGCCVFK